MEMGLSVGHCSDADLRLFNTLWAKSDGLFGLILYFNFILYGSKNKKTQSSHPPYRGYALVINTI